MALSLLRVASAAALTLSLSSCSGGTGTPAPTTAGVSTTGAPVTGSFRTDVAPLLAATCAGCHTPQGNGSQDFVLFDAAGAVSYAAASGDIARIVQQVQSGRMPKGGARLTAAQVASLTAWQQQGAPNN